MAPSSRTRKSTGVKTEPRIKTLNLGKVSKSRSKPVSNLVTKSRTGGYGKVLAEHEAEPKTEVRHVDERTRTPKRKRAEVESEDEENFVSERAVAVHKKPKFRLLTPPHSQSNTDNEECSPIQTRSNSWTTLEDLPETLGSFISLHAAFLKAFSLHFAHNGMGSPVELNTLMMSTTRIWRKRTVCKVDFQRMLAFYEVNEASPAAVRKLDQKLSPFKLVTSGLGLNVRTNVEFCGGVDQRGPFNEQQLQTGYETKAINIFGLLKTNPASFVHGPVSNFPILTSTLGIQTQAYRSKAATTKQEILSKASKKSEKTSIFQPDLSKLSISDQSVDQTPASVKSRTLSLFDRVRAKGITNASNISPTSDQLTRRHAIGRIPEIVEFLRMKQAQKSQGASSILDLDELENSSAPQSSYRPKQTSKISFSLNQVIREVRESVSVPVSAEEIQMVIRILANELPQLGGWVRIFEMGTVTSVTLNGSGIGLSGLEVKRLLET